MSAATTTAAPEVAAEPLLAVSDLAVEIREPGRTVAAIRGVDVEVHAGEAVGLVGESGSGKSMTLRTVMGLLPAGARVVRGSVRFAGQELLDGTGRAVRRVRGTGISMVFQEPAIVLNPVMPVGRQIVDAVAEREGLGHRAARRQAVELMERVGITDPAQRVDAYPFELSGGMRQRVMIAAAVASRPRLILCDEPTTALDVTVQAQILDLFADLRDDLGAGLLYVTHDLAVVAQLCSRVAVMRRGEVVETGPLVEVFRHPAHPYTRALIEAIPRLTANTRIRAGKVEA